MYNPNGGARADLGAVVVVVIDEKTSNFALVMDHQKPEPHYWKFPGGKIEVCDIDPMRRSDDAAIAKKAAEREAEEETGLPVQVMQIGLIEKRTHSLYVFVGLADFSGLAGMGDEGERVKAFSLSQIRALSNFMPNHVPILELALAKIKAPATA